ncbi:putative gastrointestinal growth factor xP4 [Clytia hemisphaerica]|uniref:putative gastrointestinal growth factor xP4 n=1 Tax=Clytia hemisphaerica TaxID=252671 RepID=UPI0034D598E1
MALLGLFLAVVVTCAISNSQGTVCRDTNKFCSQMTRYGACNFHRLTREQCQRRCRLCEAECDAVSNEQRRECGFPGIEPKHCESRGCCWGAIADKKKPWCFYPKSTVCRDTNKWCPQMTTHGACGFYKPTQEQCPRRCGRCNATCDIARDTRRECGHKGITLTKCESRGCCFRVPVDINRKNTPWCFYPEEQCKFIEGHKRKDCGHLGISKDECMDKGCCWSPLVGASKKHPWCHHSE